MPRKKNATEKKSHGKKCHGKKCHGKKPTSILVGIVFVPVGVDLGLFLLVIILLHLLNFLVNALHRGLAFWNILHVISDTKTKKKNVLKKSKICTWKEGKSRTRKTTSRNRLPASQNPHRHCPPPVPWTRCPPRRVSSSLAPFSALLCPFPSASSNRLENPTQSINQSINQNPTQSINQSINRSISHTINQSINQNHTQSIDQSIERSIKPAIERSIKQSIERSIRFFLVFSEVWRKNVHGSIIWKQLCDSKTFTTYQQQRCHPRRRLPPSRTWCRACHRRHRRLPWFSATVKNIHVHTQSRKATNWNAKTAKKVVASLTKPPRRLPLLFPSAAPSSASSPSSPLVFSRFWYMMLKKLYTLSRLRNSKITSVSCHFLSFLKWRKMSMPTFRRPLPLHPHSEPYNAGSEWNWTTPTRDTLRFVPQLW